jgi:DNA polymerase-3 subunit epsilon
MATGSGPRASRAVAGLTGYVVLVGVALAALMASGADPVALVVLALVAVVVLVGLLRRVLGGTATALGRISADTALIAGANPTHRLDPAGAGDLEALATAVNRLADERESALRGAEVQAEAARRDVESERNRLAALMAQLTVAVVVCNGEGRILLYNEAARALVDDDTPVGLGRSVFTVVDRGLVAHAMDRLATGAESVYTATTLHGDQLLRVRVTLVGEAAPGVPDATGDRPQVGAGFVLVLEDLTRQARAGEERERVMRGLTEATRASLGSIRAAVESVLDFPDLTSDERERFLGIVHDEADSLGSRVDDLAVESSQLADDGVLTEIAADDLLGVLRRELERAGVACSVPPATEALWLRADGHAVARALAHLVTRLREEGDGPDDVALVCGSADGHARVDVRWAGSPPPAATVEALLAEPLPDGGTTTVRGVAHRHGAEVWCGHVDDATAYLRMLLPTAVGAEGQASPRTSRVTVGSRPEFYDFDLFTVGSRPAEIVDHRLDEMSFTVFDTETTGLDPAGGDRIIAVGAVHPRPRRPRRSQRRRASV